MTARTVLAISVWALTFAGLANAGALEYQVNITEGPLTSGLRTLQSQTGIELLYDGDVVREFQAPPVVGTLTTGAALQQLLSETELTVRRASSGAWIIERQTTAPLAQQDAAVAEILVVGRRTQNADIRRTERDVQPYTVATGEEIRRAHRDNIDQFISSRVTTNTTIIQSLTAVNADMMSSVDLRGMGDADTVVLIDGRRMPGIPFTDTGLRQADLNSIPLHAIDRIELLTGAAGGIHGFGALGGVVNVVLDRDVDGLEVFTTQGISSRGDARRHSVEARFGQSFNEGSTDFMVFAAHQELDTLRTGEREFVARDRRQTAKLAPEFYPLLFTHGNSIEVRSLFAFDPDTFELIAEPDLTLKPEFGGGTLRSNLTYLPLGFSGDNAALATALREHAGAVDFSNDRNVTASDLGPNPQSDAVFANFRHRFQSGWETYLDAVLLRSRGESHVTDSFRYGLLNGSALMAPESPANPFNEYVNVSYPILLLEGGVEKRVENSRYTVGLEGGLPFDWRGTAEVSWGRLHYSSSNADALPANGVFFGLLGDPSDLDTNPLGDWDAFERVTKTGVWRSTLDLDFNGRFGAQSLRLAGPIFHTRAGPATLTMLVERRSERVPDNTYIATLGIDEIGEPNVFREDPRSQRSRSYYGELRTRVFDEEAHMPLIRGLEFQLAIRRDDREDDFSSDPDLPDSEFMHTRFAGTAYTAGAKVSPARWLMLRASYATGEQPPPLRNLVSEQSLTFYPGETTVLADPKRGGNFLGDEAGFDVLLRGNSGLRMARANTLFLGTVLTPFGEDGPSFALDYSRIRTSRDIHTYEVTEIFAHEDAWPGRVRRAPLTDEDRANGYTGGLVQVIDDRDTDDGRREVEAYDLRAEWPLSFLGGRLRLYADATYHKRNLQKARFVPDVVWDGYLDGPLKRRANGGFDWSTNKLTIGANLQYFSSSLIFTHDFFTLSDEDNARIQGSRHIPSQKYLDLNGSWRISTPNLGPVDNLTIDVGMVNVLDTAPPRENSFFNRTNPGSGYSRYGDPRMRRFELGVSCQF